MTMGEDMIFSVVVPFRNEEKHIAKCIRSLLGQDFIKGKYELVFINNNSSDRSVDIVRSFPGLYLFNEKKKGAYAARNTGICRSRGKIIAFTDADCAVKYDWLSMIYEGMQKTQADIVLGHIVLPTDSSGFVKRTSDYVNAKIEYILGKELKRYVFGYTNNMAVKRGVFDKSGMFKEVIRAGDTEFVQRCLSNDVVKKIAYLPDMIGEHMGLKTFRGFVRKQMVYGFYSNLTDRKCYISCMMNLRLYLYCCRKNIYKAKDRAGLFALLVIGKLYYVLGRIAWRILRGNPCLEKQ